MLISFKNNISALNILNLFNKITQLVLKVLQFANINLRDKNKMIIKMRQILFLKA